MGASQRRESTAPTRGVLARGRVTPPCEDVAVQDDITPDVSEQVWRAADPSGENRALIEAAVHGGDEVPLWMRRLGLDVGEAWEQLMSVGVEYRRNVVGVTGAMVVLVPRGWAPMNMKAETVFRAVEMVDEGRGDEADEMLAGQWEGEGAWRLSRSCQRVESMGATDPELQRTFGARARLLRLAMDHHLQGRYDASIPILQSQVEGIVMDLTNGKQFFTKGRLKADLVDDSQFVSIKAGLAVLQAAYGQGVGETQTAGSLSRHGVAHGRELAYDTRVNSAKNWSLVDGLVEWALPRARDLVQARRAKRQVLNAGSHEMDERGRRVDDREIAETRDVLRLLQTSAMGWHAQHGVFRDDLVGGVYGTDDFRPRGLPLDHELNQRVRGDGQEVAYWRRTASGRVMALAVTAQGDDGFVERLYAGPDVPAGLPSEGPEEWARHGETPPDWS